jgi:hypothetical protein
MRRKQRSCSSLYRKKQQQPNKPDKSVEELCKQMNQFELTPSRLMLLGDIPYNTPTPLLATTPANAQRDWDISYHNNNQSPSSPSICEEQPASATTLIPTPTHAPYKKKIEVDSTRPDAAAEVQNELLINMLDLIDQLSNRLQAVEALLHTTSNNTGERPANEQQQLSNSEWQSTKKHAAAATLSSPPYLKISNQFEILHHYEGHQEEQADDLMGIQKAPPINQATERPSSQNKKRERRPPVVTSAETTNEQVQQQPQPELAKRTLIMSDSMCRNIRKRDIQALCNKKKDTITISKHPGATAEQIKDYSNWWYNNFKPDTLIVCAGANDLLYENGRCRREREVLSNESEIVEKVLSIGVEARERGVKDIYFNKLYMIRDIFNTFTNRFNDILEQRCQELGFYIIDHSDIGLGDLSDGLHVDNKDGHAKYKHNIMKCAVDTYIHRNVNNIVVNRYSR